jgi:hypothetical protein
VYTYKKIVFFPAVLYGYENGLRHEGKEHKSMVSENTSAEENALTQEE